MSKSKKITRCTSRRSKRIFREISSGFVKEAYAWQLQLRFGLFPHQGYFLTDIRVPGGNCGVNENTNLCRDARHGPTDYLKLDLSSTFGKFFFCHQILLTDWQKTTDNSQIFSFRPHFKIAIEFEKNGQYFKNQDFLQHTEGHPQSINNWFLTHAEKKEIRFLISPTTDLP